MTKLKKLSAAKLKEIIDETQAELTRRKNIDAATVEIRSILRKFNIDFQDIDLNIITRTGGKSSIKKAPKSQNRAISAAPWKQNIKTQIVLQPGLGRGRTPAWVQAICQNEGIDIDGFKKDDRFRC